MRNILVSSLCCLSFLLTGCTFTKKEEPTNIQISIKEPERLRFSGKGAAAGVMMSSSMGAMGIAIGVAIDEGIAKDIESNAIKAGFNFKHLLKQALLRKYPLKQKAIENINVTVERYAFKIHQGKNDPVIPEIILTIKLSNESVRTLKFPMSVPVDDFPLISLDTAKTNGMEVIRVYKLAIEKIVETI